MNAGTLVVDATRGGHERLWRRLGLPAAVIFTVLAWASAFPVIRLGMRSYTAGPFALLRFGVASAVLAALVAGGVLRVNRLPPHAVGVLALGGLLGVAVYHVSLNWGEQTVAAGTASLLVNTSPLFTVMLGTLLLGERPGRLGVAGLVVGFGGTAVLAVGVGGGLEVEPGVAAVLLAAIAQAAYFVIQRHQAARRSAAEIAAYTIWFGTAFLLPFAPGLGAQVLGAPVGATAAALYLGLVPSALAHLTWAYVLSRLPAGRAATLLYGIPPVALLMGWGWLGEVPAPLSVAGGAMALGGAVLATAQSRERHPTIPAASWRSFIFRSR